MASDPAHTPSPRAWRSPDQMKSQLTMSSIAAIGERRRALQMLALSPIGCTETLMLAHGFGAEMLGRLVIDGFARAQRETMVAGHRQVAVKWLRITDLGRVAISNAFSQRWPSALQR